MLFLNRGTATLSTGDSRDLSSPMKWWYFWQKATIPGIIVTLQSRAAILVIFISYASNAHLGAPLGKPHIFPCSTASKSAAGKLEQIWCQIGRWWWWGEISSTNMCTGNSRRQTELAESVASKYLSREKKWEWRQQTSVLRLFKTSIGWNVSMLHHLIPSPSSCFTTFQLKWNGKLAKCANHESSLLHWEDQSVLPAKKLASISVWVAAKHLCLPVIFIHDLRSLSLIHISHISSLASPVAGYFFVAKRYLKGLFTDIKLVWSKGICTQMR